MNKKIKVYLLILTAFLMAVVFAAIVAPSAEAAGPSVTVKLAIRNTNWLVPTYCSGARLRTTSGTVIKTGSYSNFWWAPFGCNVTYTSVPSNMTYRFEVNGYVDRVSNRNFTVLFDYYVKQPSSGSTVDLGTITFYK